MTKKLEQFYTQLDLGGTKLAHFGIRGMRWGVRRSKEQLSRSASGLSTDSPDAIRARETLGKIRSKGSLSAVSDADLNHLVNRLNLEKRFSEINPQGLDKRHAQVKKALAVGTTMNEAIKFINTPSGKLMLAALGKSGLAAAPKGKHFMPYAQQAKALNDAAVGKKKKKK